jgi:exodeoxyribonuclease VIII
MAIIPCGLHSNLPEHEYRQLDYINQSSLKEIQRSPAHYKAAKESPISPTTSMQFGSALHCFILEPSKFEKQFAVAPVGISDRRTKAWKDFEKDANGRAIVSHDDYLGFVRVKDQIANDHSLHYLLGEGLPEATVVWDDRGSGLRCKARLDFITPNNIIVDVKTSKDARQFSFARSMYDYGYHFQAAFYIDALCTVSGIHRGAVQFKFIVIENTAPFSIALYRLDEKSIELGRAQYQQALQTLAKCREMNSWPGYTVKETEISLPKFVFGEE